LLHLPFAFASASRDRLSPPPAQPDRV